MVPSGTPPPPASRWSVKNRGVHCNLVLWLMRLSSTQRNRVREVSSSTNISQRSFSRKSSRGTPNTRSLWVTARWKRIFFSCAFARSRPPLSTSLIVFLVAKLIQSIRSLFLSALLCSSSRISEFAIFCEGNCSHAVASFAITDEDLDDRGRQTAHCSTFSIHSFSRSFPSNDARQLIRSARYASRFYQPGRREFVRRRR